MACTMIGRLFLTALAVLATSAARADFQPPAPNDPVYAIPTRPDRAGRVMAPVVVDGYGPVRFLVDTGCSGTMIGLSIARALGFDPPIVDPSGALSADVTLTENTMRVHDVLGPVIMPTVRVGRIDMGRFVAHDMVTPVMSFGDLSGAGGVLGTNSLRDRRLTVNFRRDQIKIESSKRAPPLDHDTVRGSIHPSGLMMVPITIGGVRATAMVDTGAERSIFNTPLRDALAARGKNANLIGRLAMVNLAGETKMGDMFLLPLIELGPLNITNLPTALVDAHAFTALGLDDQPAFILGMDVLGLSEGFALDFGTGSLHLQVKVKGHNVSPLSSRLREAGGRTRCTACRWEESSVSEPTHMAGVRP